MDLLKHIILALAAIFFAVLIFGCKNPNQQKWTVCSENGKVVVEAQNTHAPNINEDGVIEITSRNKRVYYRIKESQPVVCEIETRWVAEESP